MFIYPSAISVIRTREGGCHKEQASDGLLLCFYAVTSIIVCITFKGPSNMHVRVILTISLSSSLTWQFFVTMRAAKRFFICVGSFMAPQNVGPGGFLGPLKTAKRFSSVWVGSVMTLQSNWRANFMLH